MKKEKNFKDSIENTLKMSVDVTVRFKDSHTEEVIKRAISMASKFSNREEFLKNFSNLFTKSLSLMCLMKKRSMSLNFLLTGFMWNQISRVINFTKL